MNTTASFIAINLTTRIEGKKHGGYMIFEDDKVEIIYDTYYPNVDVYVKGAEGKKHLVMCYSGHGFMQEYHHGEWESYLEDKLYAKAVEAKKEKTKREIARKQAEYQTKFGSVSKEVDGIFREGTI